VNKVNNGVKFNDDDYEMVEEIRAMLRRFDGEVREVLIKTKASRVAHTLANNARSVVNFGSKKSMNLEQT